MGKVRQEGGRGGSHGRRKRRGGERKVLEHARSPKERERERERNRRRQGKRQHEREKASER